MCLDLLFASVFFVSGIVKKNTKHWFAVRQTTVVQAHLMICIFQEQNNNHHYDC